MSPRLFAFCGALLAIVVVIIFIKAEERTAAKSQKSPVALGYEILQKNCVRCHAIDSSGKSPLAEAPPFREVMKRYDPDDLEEALAEGIVTGHNQMPEFTFTPDQITAIIAYLSALRSK